MSIPTVPLVTSKSRSELLLEAIINMFRMRSGRVEGRRGAMNIVFRTKSDQPMAMHAATPAAALPSAQVVGNAFVEQYYHILHQSPELVYKFYQDSSVLSRPESDGTMTSVSTMDAINRKIQALEYKNYKAEIKTADAQESYQAGVIVLVTGCLTGKDNVRRKFSQTFFLAPQEKGYFVLNDVFRYVEESEPLETTSASVNGVIDSAPTAPLASEPESTDVPVDPAFDPATSFEEEDLHNGAEVCDPSDNEEGSVLEEEIVDEPPTNSTQNEVSMVDNADPSAIQEEKKSYASIVKVTKMSPASASVYVPTSSLRRAPANADKQMLVSSKPSPEPEAAPTGESAPESSNAHEEVEGHSIYVRNLPLNATVAQLEEEFKGFGAIKPGGVQVRSSKQQGYCFGFVEFESVESMQKAIEASPVTIGGRQAVVEEKRTTTRGKLNLLEAVEEAGILPEGVGLGMITSGVVVTLVAGAMAGMNSEIKVSSQAGPRALVAAVVRAINELTKMETGDLVVKVGQIRRQDLPR
ncbi:hypothetical protein RJ640_015053 [Escallonia rubra]|uniref:Uncharacterized protein n=1 Tax=Escallonia rubra TaxID=112253 RepID=A0AA88RUR2_9ASTE|nr:hypothetical protein RJ640_015053 [Escallonia rubra]